jgi:hypothetical protein
VSLSSQPAEGRCPSGKRGHATYAGALEHLVDLERRRKKERWQGSAYTCGSCGQFHISRRMFTVWRKKGRGRTRRNVVRALNE